MSTPLIPPGYVLVQPDEIIKAGDYLGFHVGRRGSIDLSNWERAEGLIVLPVQDGSYPVIRPGQPAPAVEKEWLNPWD